jgi:hypothetical protein
MLDETFHESGLKTLPVFLQFTNNPTVEAFTFGCQNCDHFKTWHVVTVIILDCKIVTNYELMVW